MDAENCMKILFTLLFYLSFATFSELFLIPKSIKAKRREGERS